MTSRPLWDVLRPLLLLDTTAIFSSHLPFEKDPTEEDMCKVAACIKHKLCVRCEIGRAHV